MTVVEFTATKRADDRALLTCPDCGAATFKLVRWGASDTPRVECANCETTMQGVSVHV